MNTSDFLKAFFDDFKKLTLRAKVAITVTGFLIWIVTSALAYPEAASARLHYQLNLLRVATAADGPLPLSSSCRNKFLELQRSLETGLVAEIDRRLVAPVAREHALTDGAYNSWTISQIAIALPNEARKHSGEFLQRFEHWRHESGDGWAEFPGDPTIKIPIVAWGISAQIAAFEKVDEKNLTFLLSQQNKDGWWGVYAGTDDSKHASTYATALAIIALSDAVSAKNSVTSNRLQVIKAIRVASDWLRVKRTGPFWLDYPNRNGTARPALSGIVLHSLHRATEALGDGHSAELSDFGRAYISSLRAEHFAPDFSEVAGLNVHANNIDHVRIYVYPSKLLGIVASYKSGSLRQRAEAIAWVDAIADDILKARAITTEHPWIAAEYLIAINLLLGKNG